MGKTANNDAKIQKIVRKRLIRWYDDQGRRFPWRKTNDPYKILIAEILLRRTTATAVSRIYNSFLKRFENPTRLARAKESTIACSLSSLGLQSVRSRQLRKMASVIVKQHSGNIPRSSTDLLALPGVGAYIASAVRNFAFGHPVPLVDGNIVHFISRVFGIEFTGQADLGAWDFMTSFGDKNQDAKLYWGIIDLVALVCLRQRPKCSMCPLSEVCKYPYKGDNSVANT
ncbi:MAG: DNA glycosylase [Candidatus Thorarchaeota archaeon]